MESEDENKLLGQLWLRIPNNMNKYFINRILRNTGRKQKFRDVKKACNLHGKFYLRSCSLHSSYFKRQGK